MSFLNRYIRVRPLTIYLLFVFFFGISCSDNYVLEETVVDQSIVLKTDSTKEKLVAFEILRFRSFNNLEVWLTTDLTQEEFAQLDLPIGWMKNQPREGVAFDGNFSHSPGNSKGEGLAVMERFGCKWLHVANVTDTNYNLERDEDLLKGRKLFAV